MGSDDRFKAILDSLHDGVYFVDRQRRITYWNRGAERISGYSASRVIGHSCADSLLMHVDEAGTPLCQTDCPLARTLADGEPRETQIFLHHADGHRVPVIVRVTPERDADGTIVGAVEVFSDNSSALAVLNRVQELDAEATRDPLTGIGNRRHIENRLEAAVLETQRSRLGCGVMVVDLDDFKQVNDRYGHDVGDRVLQTAAQTLRHNLRETDAVGRWGGEEFVVVAMGVTIGPLVSLANKMRALAAQSSVEAGTAIVGMTVSIGATVIRPEDTAESVFRRADQLLYQSKTAGKNRVSFAP